MTMKRLIAVATGAVLVGCAEAPTITEADFGKSVTSLVKAQVADPATLTNPSTAPVTGVDGDYANNVIKAMREQVSKPESVRQMLQIQVPGSMTGGQ